MVWNLWQTAWPSAPHLHLSCAVLCSSKHRCHFTAVCGVPPANNMVFNVGGVEDRSIPEGLLNFRTCSCSAPQAEDQSLAQSVSNLVTRKGACNEAWPMGRLLNKHKLQHQINTWINGVFSPLSEIEYSRVDSVCWGCFPVHLPASAWNEELEFQALSIYIVTRVRGVPVF